MSAIKRRMTIKDHIELARLLKKTEQNLQAIEALLRECGTTNQHGFKHFLAGSRNILYLKDELHGRICMDYPNKKDIYYKHVKV